MENKLSLHLKMFNTKVKQMNQTGSRDLVLSAQEARNIHADLFELLALCSNLSNALATSPQQTSGKIQMDGGGF